MKTTTILPIAGACLASLVFSSCALDPDYKEYKKQKDAEAAATNNPYGAPAAGTANPYGVPQAGGETGSYTQTAAAAPYQPLPGVASNTPTSPNPVPTAGAPTADGASHTVVSGDSLWGLARKYGTTIESIQAANGLTTTSIRTGQTLTIPGR